MRCQGSRFPLEDDYGNQRPLGTPTTDDGGRFSACRSKLGI